MRRYRPDRRGWSPAPGAIAVDRTDGDGRLQMRRKVDRVRQTTVPCRANHKLAVRHRAIDGRINLRCPVAIRGSSTGCRRPRPRPNRYRRPPLRAQCLRDYAAGGRTRCGVELRVDALVLEGVLPDHARRQALDGGADARRAEAFIIFAPADRRRPRSRP